MIKFIEDYKKELVNCLNQLDCQDIKEAADIIFDAYKRGKQIFIMGNGGSGTTASHFARDLRIGTAIEGKPRVRATSLTDNAAIITALANDTDYSTIFEEQLIGQSDEGDVVIAISGSGNSPNVVKAIEFARRNGAITIGFIGFSQHHLHGQSLEPGGKLKKLVHKAIILASEDYGQVESVHLGLAHIISSLVKERIANG